MKTRLLAKIIAVLAIASPALADVNIVLNNGSIWQTGKGLDSTEAFAQIHNEGSTADVLTGWSCSIAKTTTLLDAKGTALTSLPIPAKTTVTLSVNALHLQLKTLNYPIVFGSVIPCAFTFQNAGSIGGYLNSVPPPASP